MISSEEVVSFATTYLAIVCGILVSLLFAKPLVVSTLSVCHKGSLKFKVCHNCINLLINLVKFVLIILFGSCLNEVQFEE